MFPAYDNDMRTRLIGAGAGEEGRRGSEEEGEAKVTFGFS
jgi:hypothetical protein